MVTKEEPREALWLQLRLARGSARMYKTLGLLSSTPRSRLGHTACKRS